MLTEERYKIILETLAVKRVVTICELTAIVGHSESTIRRDLAALDHQGKLNKVHGGATVIEKKSYAAMRKNLSEQQPLYLEDKYRIGKYAATLVNPGDLIFIDAGTTTAAMIHVLDCVDAIFVTNGLPTAELLRSKNLNVTLLGGKLRNRTGALIGEVTLDAMKNLNFTTVFVGVNGIDLVRQYTTPNISEAKIKETAVRQSQKAYILADPSKFNKITPVTFSDFKGADIITTCLNDERYREAANIIEVDKDIQMA